MAALYCSETADYCVPLTIKLPAAELNLKTTLTCMSVWFQPTLASLQPLCELGEGEGGTRNCISSDTAGGYFVLLCEYITAPHHLTAHTSLCTFTYRKPNPELVLLHLRFSLHRCAYLDIHILGFGVLGALCHSLYMKKGKIWS